MSDYQLYLGDCLDFMRGMDAVSVDAVITDLPYGTTACEWDAVIPFEPMWEQVKRVLKPRGVFLTTASQPFTSALIMSNVAWFKQELVWSKDRHSGFMHAKNAHIKAHENILVFSNSIIAHTGEPNRMTYNPQGLVFKPQETHGKRNEGSDDHRLSRPSDRHSYIREFTNYPISVLSFSSVTVADHPTQKPVALYEYLVRTYTNHGETVLDIAMGSGTTGVSCVKTGRRFIGVEKRQDYYAIAERRIRDAAAQPVLFTLDAPKLEYEQAAMI